MSMARSLLLDRCVYSMLWIWCTRALHVHDNTRAYLKRWVSFCNNSARRWSLVLWVVRISSKSPNNCLYQAVQVRFPPCQGRVSKSYIVCSDRGLWLCLRWEWSNRIQDWQNSPIPVIHQVPRRREIQETCQFHSALPCRSWRPDKAVRSRYMLCHKYYQLPPMIYWCMVGSRGTFIEFRNGMINVSPIGRNARWVISGHSRLILYLCIYFRSTVERNEFEAYDKVYSAM